MIRSSVIKLVLTCEHGGHQVPSPLKYLEKVQPLNFDSHYTWDPGALEATQFLSQKLKAPYFANTSSRLLIDCNRSDNNPKRFPRWTKKLKASERQAIEKLVCDSYKSKVRTHVKKLLSRGHFVVVISVHSFTPVLNGKRRETELGVLYRPFVNTESDLASALVTHLKNFSNFKIHHNRPYQGHTDCFLNELFREFKNPQFTGVMFELNYGLLSSKKSWDELQWALATAVKAVLA